MQCKTKKNKDTWWAIGQFLKGTTNLGKKNENAHEHPPKRCCLSTLKSVKKIVAALKHLQWTQKQCFKILHIEQDQNT
jgi:ribosomal protein L37E